MSFVRRNPQVDCEATRDDVTHTALLKGGDDRFESSGAHRLIWSHVAAVFAADVESVTDQAEAVSLGGLCQDGKDVATFAGGLKVGEALQGRALSPGPSPARRRGEQCDGTVWRLRRHARCDEVRPILRACDATMLRSGRSRWARRARRAR